MAKAKHYIPNRAGAVTPYLVVRDGQAALAWYQNVFGATIDSSMEGENGAVMHAELRFGPDQIYLAQEFPGSPLGRRLRLPRNSRRDDGNDPPLRSGRGRGAREGRGRRRP